MIGKFKKKQEKDYVSVQMGDFSLKCDMENVAFWDRINKNNWEPETLKILSTYLEKQDEYCDIGAWIGPTAIYSSFFCKEVTCFEPDITAYSNLLNNIKRNDIKNIAPYNIALSDTTGLKWMSSFGSKMGDSMTSLLGAKEKEGFNAFTLGCKEAIDVFNFKKFDFIKIDIEGGEFSLIPEMKNYIVEHKPKIWLSLHAPFLEEDERKENLENIIEVMSCYSVCINSELRKVNVNELLSEESMTKFPAFLFMDE